MNITCLYNNKYKWIYAAIILLLTNLLSTPVFAQLSTDDEIIKEMDLSIFKDKSFLNKAIVIDEMLQPFRDKQLQKEREYTYQEGSIWFNEMFNLVERGDVANRKKPDRITGVINRTRGEK